MGGERFQERLKNGILFEEKLINYLSSHSEIIDIAQNGTEHTHSKFVGLLRNNNSEPAKFVRYAPDGVYVMKDGDVIHFDAKASKTIEKDAYIV